MTAPFRKLFVSCLLLAVAYGALAWQHDPSRLTEHVITLKPEPNTNELGIPIVDPPKRASGYFKLDRETQAAQMFYFFFQARKDPASAPVVLWMTGGPGCSSELAVLYENGPYTLNRQGTDLVETEYGWDATHNMIFVDQPIGTGFSFTTDDADTVYNEKGVADDMLDFLWHFFEAHPDLKNRPLYITGESYAGHYVPAVSHRVWLANNRQEGPRINFKGLAVGNGLTDPEIQYNAYGDFALQNNLIGKGTRMWMSFLYPVCRLANHWCESTNWDFVCALGMEYCMATQFSPVLSSNPGINVYDITKQCTGSLCYDFTAADKFLNLKSTKEALGVREDITWTSCNYDVYGNFMGDWLHKYDDVLPEMMADGIRVMIYAGDLDLICNYLGNRRWVDALEWYGAEQWEQTADVEWVVQGKAAGKVKEVGPFSFVQVYKAGHMVPMDQALNSLAMITSWTRNLSLSASMGPHSPAAANTLTDTSASVEGLPALFDRLVSTPAETATPGLPLGSKLQPGKQQQQGVKGVSMSHFMKKVTRAVAGTAKAVHQMAGGMAAAARKLL